VGTKLKRREAQLALIASAVVVMALSTAFAIELSNTQSQSRQEVRSRVHERAVLAGALIDSLFQAGQQQALQYARSYGGRTVPDRALLVPALRAYVALLDANGHVIAASRGLTPQARAQVTHSVGV
jgi:hypothetical protein